MNDVASSKDYDWILRRAAKQQSCYSMSNAVIIPPEDGSIGRYFGLDANYRLGAKVCFASGSSDVPSTVTVPQSVMIYYDDSFLKYWSEIMASAEKDLFSSLNWDRLQIGEPVEAEQIITDVISDTSPAEAMNWLNSLFLDHSSNVLFLCTVLHAFSHIEYEMIYPAAPMFVVASLLHDDDKVVFYAIKAFSNWNSKESLKYASCFNPRQNWARKQWREVMGYIQEFGDDISSVPDRTNLPGSSETGSV